MGQATLIEAAGGVLWRTGCANGEVEVALVHRPKYDDWSIPKGKLRSGEHPLLGAAREVEEETGYASSIGRPLGEIRYRRGDAPKRVRYWSMRAGPGTFVPGREVDRIRWLAPSSAAALLAPDRDRPVMTDFADLHRVPTRPLVVVRHASAGSRSRWHGHDADRPLDDLGRRQAEALVTVLRLYAARRVLSADAVRCIETVRPFASAEGLAVDIEPLFSEQGYTGHPGAAIGRLMEVAGTGVATVVCTQRLALPGLLRGLCDAYGLAQRAAEQVAAKAGFYVFHLPARGDTGSAVAERFDPPVAA